MEEKKKILHLVEAFGGGVFTFLVELINNLSDDYDVVIAYSKRNQTPENFKSYFKENVKFIEVKNFTRSIGIKDFKACKEVRKIVKEENPNIVHMHSSKAGIIGRLVINDKNRKLFYTPHGYSFLKQDDSKLKRFMYKFIEKITAVFNRKCTIVACSEGEYKESLKLTRNSTFVNNGVNTEKIDKIMNNILKKEINFNDLKICTVGRIGFQKNPQLFNQIAEKFLDFKFTWIGDGELRNQLKSSNIEVTGWKNREEVLKIVNENDVFLLPSLWEGLPIALLEAMYLGKICIVSNVIGNRDVIKNGENGFLCDEIEEYLKIIEYVEEQKDCLGICSMAKKDVMDKYNIVKMSEKYCELYNS